MVVLSSNNPLPAAIELDASLPPTDPTAAWWTIGYERWEGMLVHVANGITTAGNQRFSTDLSAEIYAVARPSRAFREPGIKYPGLAGLPVWDGNPEVFEIDPDRLGAVPDPDYVPGGSTYSTTGVMAYEFSGWEIWPSAFSYAPPTFPRPVRARNGGEFTVGTYNLLQLDASASDYATRLMKHSGFIRTVLGAPDVLGVEECMSITELNALAARIHTDDASLNYTAYLVEGHDVGGIDVGFLVKDTVTNAVVTQLGYDVLFTDGSFLHDRPPLLLEATYVGNGAPFAFTVMVNHTRSLNGIDDPVDGDRVRHKRLAQAQWIAQWIQDYQAAPATASRPFAMVGDLNANEITDGYVDVIGQMAGDAVPADNLLSGPNLVTPTLTKQTLSVPANDRYSYTFGGTAEVLDHALTTQTTNTWVRGFAYGRGNSDAAVNLEYDATTILRASDHDGAVLFLMSDANADGIPDDTQSADLSISKVATPDPVLSGGDADLHPDRDQRRPGRGRPDHGDRHPSRGPLLRLRQRDRLELRGEHRHRPVRRRQHAGRHGARHHHHRDRHGDVRHAGQHRHRVVVHHRPERGEQHVHDDHDGHAAGRPRPDDERQPRRDRTRNDVHPLGDRHQPRARRPPPASP